MTLLSRILATVVAPALAMTMVFVWLTTLFGLLVDINDDRELPKIYFALTLSVAMPLLVFAVSRTAGHLEGTRRRWPITLALWAFGLGLPVYGYLTAVLYGLGSAP